MFNRTQRNRRQATGTYFDYIPSEIVRLYLYPMVFFGDPKKQPQYAQLTNNTSTISPNPAIEAIKDKFCEKQVLLLRYVLEGDEEKVVGLLKCHPEVLLNIEPVTLKDSAERLITATPFQAAMRMQDMEMCDTFTIFFKRLPDGKEIQNRQIQHEFPDGKLPERRAFDFRIVAEKISSSTESEIQDALNVFDNETSLWCVLEGFRREFKELMLRERHYNPAHLQLAYLTYAYFFGSWDDHQRMLFRKQIIGYIQRFFPICYIQAYCSGLNNLIYGHQFMTRKTDFSQYTDRFRRTEFTIDVKTLLANNELGYHLVLYSDQMVTYDESHDWVEDLARASLLYQKLIEKKDMKLMKLIESAHQPTLADESWHVADYLPSLSSCTIS